MALGKRLPLTAAACAAPYSQLRRALDRAASQAGTWQQQWVMPTVEAVLHGHAITTSAGYLALNPPRTTLIFVGEGPEKPDILARAAKSPDAALQFLPFANQSEIPARYLLTDLFVLPSRGGYETWGLAVNEAMHMGVPCLVSDHVGCQHDLVTDAETGWVFSANNPASLQAKLAEALTTIARDPESIRQRVAARIAHYTYAQATAGLLSSLPSA